MARDEARAGTLPQGSVPQRLLAASLATRRAVRAHDALRPRDNPAALLDTIGSATPKPGSACTGYFEEIDTMVGAGRD